MSLISSLNIAQQALSVNQSALTVVANNIANVGTDGYSKQKVNLASITSNYSAANPTEQANALHGVTIQDIQRYSDDFLESYYRNNNSSHSYLNEYTTISSSIETMTNTLQNGGLSTALDSFYNAASALSDNPSSATTRENFIQAAKNVCLIFNSTSENLGDIENSLVGSYGVGGSMEASQISGLTKNVNTLLDNIASVNESIIKTNMGGTSVSSLLDQRDALLKKLSDLIPADVNIESTGTATVSLGGVSLISGVEVKGYMELESSNTQPPVTVNIVKDGETIAKNVNSKIYSGSIGAILDACGPAASSNLTIAGTLKGLDDMASGFASIMNTIQMGDPNGDGSFALNIANNGKMEIADDPIFVNGDSPTTSTANISAANIAINSDVLANSNLIAAARVTAGTPYIEYQNATGNNTNASLIVSSRSNIYTTEMNNNTIEGCLVNFVGDIQTKSDNLQTNLENQSLVCDEVSARLESATGVNLDEELTDLIKFQRGYQAAARVFDICSSLMEELIHLGQ